MPLRRSQRLRDRNRPPEFDHPATDFRNIRLTIGLLRPRSLVARDQLVDLCFHGDFEPSVRNPISLHFNAEDVVRAEHPPILAVPPRPGGMWDLGTVNTWEDEAVVWDGEDEGSREERSHGSLWKKWVVAFALLFFFLPSLTSSNLTSTHEACTESTTAPLISFANQTINLFLSITELGSLIFFPTILHSTLPSATASNFTYPQSKIKSLDRHELLFDNMIANFVSPIFTETARHKLERTGNWVAYRDHGSWKYAGHTWGSVTHLTARYFELSHHAKELWDGIAKDALRFWPVDVGERILDLANVLVRTNISEHETFIAKDGERHGPAHVDSIPAKLPSTVLDILERYRHKVFEPAFLDRSCRIITDCKSPQPTNSSAEQVVHPICHITSRSRGALATPEMATLYLQDWVATHRGRNLTWGNREKEPMIEDGEFMGGIEEVYFWPNETAWPGMFDLALTLAYMWDVADEILKIAENVRLQQVKDQATMWSWRKNEDRLFQSMERDLKNIASHGRFIVRDLHDVIRGIQAITEVCADLESLKFAVDRLEDPLNWVILESQQTAREMLARHKSIKGATHDSRFAIQRMVHPQAQGKTLLGFRERMAERIQRSEYGLWWGWAGEDWKTFFPGPKSDE